MEQKEKREQKGKRQQLFVNIFMFIYMALCLFVIGYKVGNMKEKLFPEKEPGMGVVLFVVAAFMLVGSAAFLFQIYVHETGHLLFALMTGYRFVSIRFGSLTFIKTEKGIRIKRSTVPETGGQCLMLPPDVAEGKYPILLYSLGGIFANGMVSMVCLVWFAFVEKASVLAVVLLIVIAVGIYLVLLNGIPLSTMGNDGYNTIVLKKDIEARKVIYRQLYINWSQLTGTRVKDMPKEWFDCEMKVPGNSLVASHMVIRFSYLIDCRQFEEARKLGTFLLEEVTELTNIHQLIIKAELLFLEMLLGGDREEIREQYKKMENELEVMQNMPFMQRVRYAYYQIVEKDDRRAKRCMKQFDKLTKKYPYPAEIEGERELMEWVDALG